jgi:hypothetical protein
MKPKLLLCLALVLSGWLPGFFNPQSAYGFEAVIQINHANLKTDCSFLKIKTVHYGSSNNPGVFFTVFVIPKAKQKSEHVDRAYLGHLGISDTNGFIAGASVERRKRDKFVVFQFSVSSKYLEKSEFNVEEVLVNEKTGDVSGDGAPVEYVFNLKEFADEK